MAKELITTDVDEAPGFRVWYAQPLSSMSSHWQDQVEIHYAVGGSSRICSFDLWCASSRCHYGMTLSAHVTRLRVCQAQHLLISPDGEISHIAFETGFRSVSRFYEAFKKVSRQPPRQYRLCPGLR